MSKKDLLKQRLLNITTFNNADTIIQTEERDEFSIIDYEGQSYIILNVENDTFTIKIDEINSIINGFDDNKLFKVSNSKSMIFIPIDGKKGILGYGKSQCDCIIFDENDFCFIEFKLNATSVEERAIRKNRKTALKQLSNTIILFDDKLKNNYEQLTLEAYVCTPLSYPRDDASWKSLAVEFLENNRVPVYETAEKSCK